MELSFIVQRLLRMSLGEVAHRLFHAGRSRLEKRFLRLYRIDDAVRSWRECAVAFPEGRGDSSRFLEEADRLCANRLSLFALKNIYLGDAIDYHRDYKSGRRAPMGFGKAIDYRDSAVIGDIKYIWEPNRHLFLPVLARAYAIERDDSYLRAFERYLGAWLDQNPFMMGVNWCSSLELGIRLINWTLGWHLMRDAIDDDLRRRWLASMCRHCWFIDRNLSGHSSANNHLIGEAAGLFIAATALPEFARSADWQRRSHRILVRECAAQNHPDGVNREQAISYQQFVLDFLLLAGLVGRRNGVGFPNAYWERLERMMEFIAAIRDVGGSLPSIGDEDDGYVLDFDQRAYGAFRSLLNTGARLFGRDDLAEGDAPVDCKTAFFAAQASLDRPARGASAAPLGFPSGGYFVLGADFGTRREQKLVFDCGPLGYLSIAAHGHADALSFTLSAAGTPVIVDPGTYAYHADRKWRNYFRGTPAHNTVAVDGQDQSVMTGNFMWGRKARATLDSFDGPARVRGAHDGYARLADPVRHAREIEFRAAENRWRIVDELSCRGAHEVLLSFHVHPDCGVAWEGRDCVITFAGGVCRFRFDDRMALSIHRGEEHPPRGWYSPSYDVKVPAPTLVARCRIEGATVIETCFEIHFS